MIYWILHCSLLLIGALAVLRLSKNILPSRIFWLGLFFKLASGILLGLIFYYYYGQGDTITFFNVAKSQDLSFYESEPRTAFFIRLLIPVVAACGRSYWITSLWFSFISFVSCWYLVVVLSRLYPTLKYLIVVCFLFIPSGIFWASGLLKDTLIFSAVAALIAVFLSIYVERKVSVSKLLIVLFSGVVLLKLKHYLFITLTIYLSGIVSILIFKNTRHLWKWGVALVIVGISFLAIQHVHPYLTLDKLAWTIYENNQAIIRKTLPENQLHIVVKDSTWSAVLHEIPAATHAGLLRPSIMDDIPFWGVIHQLENLLLGTLIFISLLLGFKRYHSIDWPLALVSTFCIVLLATILPLSAPNFGTLVRYRNAYFPFLFFLSGIIPYRYFLKQGQ